MNFVDAIANCSNFKGNPTFNNVGDTTGNITLEIGKITTANFTGNHTVTLPTLSDTTQQVTCILQFTTTNAAYPDLASSNVLVKDRDTLSYSTSSSAINKLIFTSISGNKIWEATLEKYGA